ncbi:MAG: type 2 isopentenyl-diphosphate Delta-isomerase [Candidatus Thermoplasmatota archaeon]|nr:type 2 isopentenyl-diphosphate Delta-isomerase [Candidatus Thermoplasmatota archaeon]MBS3789296.1 type 2 isopentenyl-diphosphate Delta-isomerase [Candidatus Thermoplasmatota archaeon]
MIESRKEDHVKISLKEDVDSSKNYWEDIEFYHHSVPEIDFQDIDIGVDFLDKSLDAPLMIAGMTGGYEGAEDFNERLASVAETLGIGFGVGSQRAALENDELRKSYETVARYSPPMVLGNIGAPQLIKQKASEALSLAEANELLEMIEGDYLAVHFNYLQEAVQPEGDLKAKGVIDSLKELSSKVPTIAKETGAGVSPQTALTFQNAGVKAIDVGGKGGTSFSAVEHYRNQEDKMKTISKNLWNWGIPTPVSIVECRGSVSLPLIATGGIKNGVQVAKAISLGADIVGMAGGVLRALADEKRTVEEYFERVIRELKTVMFLLGCEEIDELLNVKKIFTGDLKNWID